MTRKCALCKGTNYKNNYSFFSAPKDAETRKKWQVALALENYTVTDDTYVCSKHFHENDIITHWISGVPPQVVKVKYKKCRLRPGAVPGRNSHSVSVSVGDSPLSMDQDKININAFSIFKKERPLENDLTFLISKKKTPNDDKNVVHSNSNMSYQTYSKLQGYTLRYGEESYDFQNVQLTNTKDINKRDADATYNLKFENSESKKKKLDKLLERENNPNLGVTIESVDTGREKKNIQVSSRVKTSSSVERNVPRYASCENKETSVKTCEHDVSSTQDTSVYDKGCKNNILFEDFLEVCTELSIPYGWSCLITSKGHDMTVVYLYMNITKNGLPFVEKQIFIRSDMVLHYSVANTEIDPLMHNLIKERKCNKIRNLLDVEILIAEFHQRAVCQGICDSRDYKSVDMIKLLYKDGVKWRHISCSLILNNDNSRCTRCATLSR